MAGVSDLAPESKMLLLAGLVATVSRSPTWATRPVTTT